MCPESTHCFKDVMIHQIHSSDQIKFLVLFLGLGKFKTQTLIVSLMKRNQWNWILCVLLCQGFSHYFRMVRLLLHNFSY